jgi:hypothetical protein
VSHAVEIALLNNNNNNNNNNPRYRAFTACFGSEF